MPSSPVELTRTELDFLHRLLLDLQRRLGEGEGEGEDGEREDEQSIAALELALAMLRWNGDTPLELDVQVGLGAAVQVKLGADAMCAYRRWREERRKACLTTP